MGKRSDQAAREIERRHFERTGSDDFDTPDVARQVRSQAGLTQATPEELYDAAVRAYDAEGIEGPERESGLARVREAVGL